MVPCCQLIVRTPVILCDWICVVPCCQLTVRTPVILCDWICVVVVIHLMQMGPGHVVVTVVVLGLIVTIIIIRLRVIMGITSNTVHVLKIG